MSKADEMFEKLGYNLKLKNKNLLVYQGNGINIFFDLLDEKIMIKSAIVNIPAYIGSKTLQAINEKVKELRMDMKLKDLKHIPEISYYNNNFYILGDELIHAISDDDNTTELYKVNFNKMQEDYIGYCYVSENDFIYFDKGVDINV